MAPIRSLPRDSHERKVGRIFTLLLWNLSSVVEINFEACYRQVYRLVTDGRGITTAHGASAVERQLSASLQRCKRKITRNGNEDRAKARLALLADVCMFYDRTCERHQKTPSRAVVRELIGAEYVPPPPAVMGVHR